MKNYDLSQYMLRRGDILIFPITNEEIGILKNGRTSFEEHFKMPYVAGEFQTERLNEIQRRVDMENDYWFMNSLWIVVDIKSKEIFGTLRYQKCGDKSKVLINLTVFLDAQNLYEEAINLFVDFLSVNGYKNIEIEGEKEVI